MAATTERVPAWKRMGLKLKNGAGGAETGASAGVGASAGAGAAEAGSGSSAVGPVGQPSRATGSKASTNDSTTASNTAPGQPPRKSHKRKLDPPSSETATNTHNPSHVHNHSSSNIHSSKKPRRESTSQQTPKKVTFEEPPAETPTKTKPKPKSKSLNSTAAQQHSKALTSPSHLTPNKGQANKKGKGSPGQPKSPKAKQPSATAADVKPALEYLRQWKTSRDSWKFNKNHQSTLIKHAFDPRLVPAEDIDTFYEYIRDLKGFVRTRLREMAMEVQMRDIEDGYAAFPEADDDAMDLDEQQASYDAILAGILERRRRQYQQHQPHQGNAKRKYFAESQYVAESTEVNGLIVRRLVKRMRAEMVLDELSEGESTDSSTTSTASSKTIVASDSTNATSNSVAAAPMGNTTTTKINELPGRRRRKLRVNMEDSSSSSSESDSESDSDSDSDTSSSEDDSDSDQGVGPQPADHDTSSSSDSSSASSSESGSEGDSDDDDDD